MPIHYLIDPFTNNGDIIDVITTESGSSDSTGATVIRIPDGVAIRDNPSNLADLLTAKYDGLLASYAGFTEIVADACMDELTLDPAGKKGALLSAGFINHCTVGQGCTLGFASIPLPFAPTQCVVTWEVYTYADVDDKTGRYQRVYQEADPNLYRVDVMFDGFQSNVVTDGTVFNIPIPDQGNNLIISFATPFPTPRLYLGSWAVIF